MFDVLVTHEKVKKLYFHANIVFMNEQEQPRERKENFFIQKFTFL